MIAALVLLSTVGVALSVWALRLERRRMTLLGQLGDLERAHYESLAGTDTALRMLRHDMHNHLQTVRLLLEGDPERACAYLDELEGALRGVELPARPGAAEVLLDAHRQAFARIGLCLELDDALAVSGFMAPAMSTALLACALDAALLAARRGSLVRAGVCGRGFFVRFSCVAPRLRARRELRELSALAAASGARLFFTVHPTWMEVRCALAQEEVGV